MLPSASKANLPYGKATSASACWWRVRRDTRSKCWTPKAASPPGVRRPSASRVIGPRRSSEGLFALSLPPRTSNGVPEQMLRMARGEGQARYEGWRVRKDGSRFCVEGAITAVRDESGALNGYSNVAHDVTDRKQTEEALRQSETRFRTLSEGLPQLVWTSLPDGRCDYLSPQWVRYTGIPEERQLGFGWLEQIDPADRERTAAAWKRTVETRTTLEVEFRTRGANGAHRWFTARSVPLRSSQAH